MIPGTRELRPHSSALATLFLGLLLGLGCAEPATRADVEPLLEQGEVERAAELLKEWLAREPNDAATQHLYGLVLLGTKRASQAAWRFARAAEAPEQAIESGVLLVQAHLVGGAPRDAIAAADRVLALEPGHAEVRFLRSRALRLQHRDDEALEELDRLLAERPDDESLERARLSALIELGRREEIERSLDLLAAITLSETEATQERLASLCMLRAKLRNEVGDMDGARQAFEACLARHPEDPPLLVEAVRFFDATDARERSEAILAQALKPTSKALSVRVYAAERHRDAGDAPRGEALLRDATALEPTAEAWFALADHHVVLRDFPAARASADQAVALLLGVGVDSLAGAQLAALRDSWLLAYGEVVAQQGDGARTREILSAVSEPAQRLFLEGRLQLSKGDPERALGLYEEGLGLAPVNPDASYRAAQAALELGATDRAITHLRESLRADPALHDAGWQLAAMWLNAGHRHSAVEALILHLRGHPYDVDALRLAADLLAERTKHSAEARERVSSFRRRLAAHTGSERRAAR